MITFDEDINTANEIVTIRLKKFTKSGLVITQKKMILRSKEKDTILYIYIANETISIESIKIPEIS